MDGVDCSIFYVNRAIQDFANSVMTFFLALYNKFPDELWNDFRHLVIFIPFVIHAQYKLYKYERQIHELTRELFYTLRKNQFMVASQRSETSLRTSSHCIKKRVRSLEAIRCSTTAKPRRRSVLQMGGVSNSTQIHKVRSFPELVRFRRKLRTRNPLVNLLQNVFHQELDPKRLNGTTTQASEFSASYGFQWDSQNSEGWKVEYGAKKMEISSSSPVPPTTRLNRYDMDDDRSTTNSQDTNSTVMKIFRKPQDSIHRAMTVEYCNVFKKKCAPKYSKGISQRLLIRTKQKFTKSNYSMISWERRTFRNEDDLEKWKLISGRNKKKYARLVKLKEMERQKLQERETTREAECLRRRAIIARIREQNRKILQEQKEMSMDDNKGRNSESVHTVLCVKPVDSIDYQAPLYQGSALSVRKLPVLHVNRRKVTVDHTPAMRQLYQEKGYNSMESIPVHMSDLEENDGEALQNIVKEPPGPTISQDEGENPILPATPRNDYDVEAPPITPSPPANFGSTSPKPAMKRAKRRLMKKVESVILSLNKVVQLESVAVKPVTADTLKINDAAEQKENRPKPKPLNVEVPCSKSLLLKKITLRKKLEERRRAEACRDFDDPIQQENKGSYDGQSSKEIGFNTIKTSIKPSVPVNKHRRCSFHGNTGRVKQGQSRVHIVRTMKKEISRSPEEMRKRWK